MWFRFHRFALSWTVSEHAEFSPFHGPLSITQYAQSWKKVEKVLGKGGGETPFESFLCLSWGWCCILLQLLFLRIDRPCGQCTASSLPMGLHQQILEREFQFSLSSELCWGDLAGQTFLDPSGAFFTKVSLPTQPFSPCSSLCYMPSWQ